jgi:linker histone H1 and H5 family
MVADAIKNSKGKRGKGISYQSIKTFILSSYGLENNKSFIFNLKRALKDSVRLGEINQTSGAGSTGSFKLIPKDSKPKKAKSVPKSVATGSKTRSPKSQSARIAVSTMPKTTKSMTKSAQASSESKTKPVKATTVAKAEDSKPKTAQSMVKPEASSPKKPKRAAETAVSAGDKRQKTVVKNKENAAPPTN